MNIDKGLIAILLISLFFLTIALLGVVYKRRCPQKIRRVYDDTYGRPFYLGTLNFCGLTMLGSFRYKNEVTISYYCLSLFWCPVIPLGCYECERESYNVIKSIYTFGGKQPWMFSEVLALYSRWFWILGVSGIIAVLQEFPVF